MKILGHTKLKKRVAHVAIGEAENGDALTLELVAPQLDTMQTIQTELPDPVPPKKANETARDKRTGEVLVDSRGRPKLADDLENEEYLEELANVGLARTTALLMSCLGDQLEVDTVRNGQSSVDYFLAIWKELHEVGLDIVTLGDLVTSAAKLCGLGGVEVASARKALGIGGKPGE